MRAPVYMASGRVHGSNPAYLMSLSLRECDVWVCVAAGVL